MNDPKLWWYIPHPDGTLTYVFDTYPNILKCGSVEQPGIVHPDNPRYPREYRVHNLKHLSTIHTYSVERVRRFIESNASDYHIAMEIDHGIFSCADNVYVCLAESLKNKND